MPKMGSIGAGGMENGRHSFLLIRETRLKAALSAGEVELAMQLISELVNSAKLGEFDVEKVNRIRTKLKESDIAMTQARLAFGSGILNK